MARRAQLWVLSQKAVPPSPIDKGDLPTTRDVRYFEAVGRIKNGVSFNDAQHDMHAVATNMQREHPDSSGTRDVVLVPLREDLVGNVRSALLLLQGAVGLVLLIACANVSSLLIARATGRRRELAIRSALGASRTDLMRELLIESLILGAVGGAIGLLAGSWLIKVLVQLLPAGLPRADSVGVDGTVAIVSVVASLATGVLFGLLPAWQASRTDAVSALKEAGGERGTARAPARSVLVVAEVALTLVLLVSAGLLANSFLRLQRVKPGFEPAHVTIGSLNLPQTRYQSGKEQLAFYKRLLDGLSQHPELQTVSLGFPGPLRGSNASGSFFIEGRSVDSRASQPFAHIGSVSGGYFAAMGIPLIAGRTFAESDADNGPGVVIASEALARKYWPGENPVGKHLRFDQNDPWMTVVGLVADVRQLGLSEPPTPLLYIPYQQFALPFTNVTVRSTVGRIRRDVVDAQGAGRGRPRPSVRRCDDAAIGRRPIRGRTAVPDAPDRHLRRAGAALAAVGVYGLISYSVTQRTREIGIRVALGAQPRQVLFPVVREGLILAVTGVAIGLVGALALTRVLSAFLFGVGATDPVTFALVSVVLMLIALAASYIPSRRALRVDPLTALRAE